MNKELNNLKCSADNFTNIHSSNDTWSVGVNSGDNPSRLENNTNKNNDNNNNNNNNNTNPAHRISHDKYDD